MSPPSNMSTVGYHRNKTPPSRPKLLIFASGTKEGGGSGFQELVENSRTGILRADIVGIVSQHADGGVRKRADNLGVPFFHFSKPWDAALYRSFARKTHAEFVALSGWLKLVRGLDPRTTINIHPGPLPRFGGKGMWGHHVHEAVIAAFRNGEVTHTAVTMHFATERYDEGPIFFQYPVLIRNDDTPDTLAERVRKIEHAWQSWITNLVVIRQIQWTGTKLIVPDWYSFHKTYPPSDRP